MTQPDNRIAELEAAVKAALENGATESAELSVAMGLGIGMVDEKIEAGQQAFSALLDNRRQLEAALAQSERDNERTNRDFSELRSAYALQAEANEKLRAFVERVDAASKPNNPIFSKIGFAATLFHLGAQARELLSALASQREAGA